MKPLWMILLLSVAAIPLTSLYARMTGAPLATGQFDQARFLVWSLIVAPGMVYGWLADYALHRRQFSSGSSQASRLVTFTLALMPLAAVYGLIGLAERNPTYYVLGDTFKALLTPFGFYLAAVGVRTLDSAKALLRALAVFGLIPGLDIGGEMMTLGYVYGRKAVFWQKFRWIWVLPVVYLVIRLNRTSLLLVPVLTLLLYYYARRFNIFRLLALGAIAMGLGILLFRFAPNLVVGTGAFGKTTYMLEKLNLVDYRTLDPSTYHRLQEAVLLKDKLAEASGFDQVVGFGSGAVFRVGDLPRFAQEFWDDEHGGYAHNIHIAPLFVYHLWGLPGLLLLSYTALALLSVGRRLARERTFSWDPSRREAYSLQLAAFLMAVGFFLYGGWNPPKISLLYFGLVVGTLWRLLELEREALPGWDAESLATAKAHEDRVYADHLAPGRAAVNPDGATQQGQ